MKHKIIALIILLSPLALFFPNVSIAGVIDASAPDGIICTEVGGSGRVFMMFLGQKNFDGGGTPRFRYMYGESATALRGYDFLVSDGSYHGAVGSMPTTDCTSTALSDVVSFEIVQEEGGGGGASYIIDVGSTVMLGGILAFFIAYWMVGLTRSRKNY